MRPRTEVASDTGSMPKTLTVPVWARHNPRTCLISVDLPAPFSPTSPNTDPRDTATDTSFRAFFDPNVRDKWAMSTTVSRMLLPRLSGCSPKRKLVLHQPANFLFAKSEGFEPVDRRPNDRLRLAHQLRACNDRVTNEDAGPVLQIEDPLVFEVSVRTNGGIRINQQIFGHPANARHLFAGLDRAGFNRVLQLFDQLEV